MDKKKEVEEELKEFEIREVNIVNNKIENNRKIRKYSGKRNKRQGKSGNKAVDNQQGENRGNRIKVIIVIIVEKRPYIK